MSQRIIRISFLYIALIVGMVLIPSGASVKSAFLSNRSVTVSLPTPAAIATHTFRFNVPGTSSVGSIQFEYCEDPLFTEPCVSPDDIDVSAAVLSSQTGETGFTIHGNTTANRLVIGRIPAATSVGTKTYVFDNITNPDEPDASIYVRIATFASNDGTGTPIDNGAVVFSTEGNFGVTAFVPPYLRFCVGLTVTLNCSNANGNSVDMGTLSPTAPKTASSQMSAYTNDE